MKNDNSINILNSINAGELGNNTPFNTIVDDKFVLKLLETRLFASDAMINGWIITGFPKNKEQINFLQNKPNFNPSLVVQLGLDDEYVQKKSAARRLDTASGNKSYLFFTGKVYYSDSKDFNQDLLKKLVVKNEDKPAILKKR